MDSQRFDNLARLLAGGISRRRVLRGLLTGIVLGREAIPHVTEAMVPSRDTYDGPPPCQSDSDCSTDGTIVCLESGCCHKENVCIDICCTDGTECSCSGDVCTCDDSTTTTTTTEAPCSCVEKACGDSDGCGGFCQGPCPDDGQTCQDGQCVCDPESCSGCCSGSACLAGTDLGFCGTGGVDCFACASGQRCLEGACVCDATSCGGCCSSGGTCLAGTDSGACGTDGEDCVECTGVDSCGGSGTAGVCGCTELTCQPGQCGFVSDGCGDFINCGGCTGFDTCGGGGTDNICGCKPATSCPAGKDCGTVPDGCGGIVACGSNQGNCPAGQCLHCVDNTCVSTCTGDQVCGTDTCCTPACPAGVECGSADDGCGGTIVCGDCAADQCLVCGGDSTCVFGCAAGEACCGGACTALGTNTDCSDCGDACADGESCSAGACTAAATTCVPDPVATTCSSGPTGKRCGSVTNNCGDVVDCGNTCGEGQTCAADTGTCPCGFGVTFNFAGNLTFSNGLSIESCTFSSGKQQETGCVGTYTCTVPGGHSFSVIASLTGQTAFAGGVRALAALNELTLEVQEVTAWDVPGVAKPKTPTNAKVKVNGNAVDVETEAGTASLETDPQLESPFKTVTSYSVAPAGLPNTGVGLAAEQTGGSGTEGKWLLPLTIAAAGAAAVARGLRRADQAKDAE